MAVDIPGRKTSASTSSSLMPYVSTPALRTDARIRSGVDAAAVVVDGHDRVRAELHGMHPQATGGGLPAERAAAGGSMP